MLNILIKQDSAEDDAWLFATSLAKKNNDLGIRTIIRKSNDSYKMCNARKDGYKICLTVTNLGE